jgi:hypothetical protein
MNINEFAKSAGLTMTAVPTDHNPSMEDGATMDHWRCTIRAGHSRMSLVFSMGSGHNGKRPELADVLYCLASDASGYENARDFADWCSEYGYDTDSRRAERTFRAVERQAKRLRSVLGESAYNTLLWDTERL